MKDRTTILLLAIALTCFACLPACTSMEHAAAAVAAVGASAMAIVEAVAPMLPPETVAKLQTTASQIDGTVQATATAVGTIADAIASMRTNVGAQFAEHAKGLQAAVTQIAELPGREEVYLVSGGTAAGGTAASRLLSHFKHTPKA